MTGQATRTGCLKVGVQLKRPLATAVCRVGWLLIVSLTLISSAALGGPADIGTETHEGELGDYGTGTGAWTSGNITQYREGDPIRFRFEVDTTSETAKSGWLDIAFSLEDAVCHFFDGSLELGGIEILEGPAVWAVTKVGSATTSGNEWIQTLQIDKAAGTSPTGRFIARVNYTLRLEDNVGLCSGSSQHSRLSNHPTNPGDVISDGLKNVPVPGGQIILLPDITVTKYIDRDGDGTFESTASAGEYAFTLDGVSTLLTDGSGTVTFGPIQVDGNHTITELQMNFSQGTYDFDHGDGINTVFAGSTATSTVYAGDYNSVQDALCNFYNTIPFPALSLDKTAGAYVDANANGVPDVGESITYSYIITNVGFVQLTGITVSDDVLGAITLSATTLDPDQQATGQKVHILSQAEIDSGTLINIATADCNETLPLNDSVNVALAQDPSIALVKNGVLETTLIGPGDRVDAGDAIVYTFAVTNTGNVTLTNVRVDDPDVTMTGGPIPALAPGETDSTTFIGTYTLTQQDIDAETFSNTAVASGTPPTGPDVTANDDDTQALPSSPSIQLTKTGILDKTVVPPINSTDVGDIIAYAFTITNTGNVTLTNVKVTDPGITVVGDPIVSLAPGSSDSTTFTGTYSLTQQDIDAEVFSNIAAASGTPPTGPDVTNIDDDTQSFPVAPAVTLIKTWVLDMTAVAPADRADAGDTVAYNFTVTNSGNVTLTNVSVTDLQVPVFGDTIASLEPGESDSTTFSSTYTLTQSDVDARTFINSATARGTSPTGSAVTDNAYAIVAVGQRPSLSIEKSGDEGPIRVGETVNYRITVTNNGNITLHNVTVADTVLGITQNVGTLAPGDFHVVVGTYGPVSESDLPGPLINTATSDSDETDPEADHHHAELVPLRIDLSLNKNLNTTSLVPGDQVTFEITITNGPNTVTATGVEVTDTLPAGYSFVDYSITQGTYAYTGPESVWSVGSLPADSSATLRVLAVVLEEGPYEGRAEVSAHNQDDIDSAPANASVAAEDDDDEVEVSIDTPSADLQVKKTVDNDNPLEGDTVVFTTLIHNDGPNTSTGIVLQDALPAGLTYISDTSNGNYNPATNTWGVGTLIAGDAISFTLSALIDHGTAGTNLTSTALIIQSEVEDPSPDNNQDSADVTPRSPESGAICKGKVIISEIAWAGTAANPEHEWIELRNIGGERIDLAGWTLRWRKKQPITPDDFQWKVVALSGELQASAIPLCEPTKREPEPPIEFIKREVDDFSWYVVVRLVDLDASYMILEHRSDLAISNIAADIIYDNVDPYLMEFSDEGDIVELLDADGEIVDTANAFPSHESSWPAGDIMTRGTMERTEPLGGDEFNNWHTNLGIITRGLDANEHLLVASSGIINSPTFNEMGLFADLEPATVLPGVRLEVALDLQRETRRQTAWPWIRVTRPGLTTQPNAIGTSIEPVYSFTGRYAGDIYWLEIDTAGLVPGSYHIWLICGEGQTVLVPITILD